MVLASFVDPDPGSVILWPLESWVRIRIFTFYFIKDSKKFNGETWPRLSPSSHRAPETGQVGSKHSSKELFEQLFNNYLEHLHEASTWLCPVQVLHKHTSMHGFLLVFYIVGIVYSLGNGVAVLLTNQTKVQLVLVIAVFRIRDIFAWTRIRRSSSFRHWPSRLKKVKEIWNFFGLLLLSVGTFASFFKEKKSQNRRNKGFSYYFCLKMEESGSVAGSGSIPLTNGSGWPNNLRIRIRNTRQ
jgi:hypothetical protein